MAEQNATNPERLLRQQESLRAIIESISSELELRPLLTRIVQHACELLAADRGTIGLVDEERNVVRTEAVYQMPPGELGDEASPGVGLAGQVLQTRQPVILNRYGDLPQPKQYDLVADAVIGLPIFWGERLIGVFGIGAEPPRTFGDQDVELLSLLARHAAIAVENARLFAAEKRRAARHAALNQVGKLIAGSLDLDELLQTAVTAVNEHLRYTSIALLLVDEDDPGTLVLTARSGIYAENVDGDYRQSIHHGLIGAAARARRPLLVTDVHQDPRYLPIPGADDIRSEVALPIVVSDELLGVFNVESTQRLTEDDRADLEIVADQLGVAIANARLFDRTQQALAETQLLYETSRRISAAMDVDDVIRAYLEQVAVRGRYVCSVVLYEFDEAGRRTAVIVRGRWSPQDGLRLVQERYPYTRDALDPVLDAAQTVTIADVHTDPRASPELRQIQTESQRPALAMIPLMARGQRIGLVILSYPSVYEWPETDLWPYQVTAAQLATAIHTRRQHNLLHRRGQELAVLHERQRLARELHDSVTQLIFSMTLIAQSIAPAWRRDPAEGEQRVGRLLDLSQNALSEMRALLFELRSAEEVPDEASADMTLPGITRLKRDGLVAALENHVDRIVGEELTVQFQAPTYRPLPLDHEIALFRITQEALNNVIKHAQARCVTVELGAEDDFTYLTVVDDGVGFEVAVEETERESGPAKTVSATGFGLRTMRERAEALGGELRISSVPGQGTTVQVRLPQSSGG